MLYVIVIDSKFGGDVTGNRPVSALEEADLLIPKHAKRCERVGTAVWLVESAEGSNDWATRLRPLIEQDERLIVAPVKGLVSGLLPGGIWPWINELSAQ